MPSCDKRQNICLQKRSSPFQFTRFEFQAPQTLSSIIHFPFIFVFLSELRKNQFSHSLKSWESLDYKESNHCLSRTCISVFGSLEIVLQHHPHATERIATLRFAQRRKIALKIFLEGCRLSQLFQSPDHNSSEFSSLSNHSF